jgi:hypothetical protein
MLTATLNGSNIFSCHVYSIMEIRLCRLLYFFSVFVDNVTVSKTTSLRKPVCLFLLQLLMQLKMLKVLATYSVCVVLLQNTNRQLAMFFSNSKRVAASRHTTI